MGRFLTAHARPGVVPPVLGALDLTARRGEPTTLGILEAYVKNDGTAFRHALGELSRFYEQVLTTQRDEAPPEMPAGSVPRLAVGAALPERATAAMGAYHDAAVALGRLVGDMHLALASDPLDPLFAPEPHSTLDQRSVYQSMRNVVGRVVRRLRTDLLRFDSEERRLADILVAQENELLRRFDILLSRRIHGARIRIHGDMHLDQILFDGRDFTIVDFEGDREKSVEERRRKRSPLRDVARMTRSFHYAAEVALADEARVRPADRERIAPWAKVWRNVQRRSSSSAPGWNASTAPRSSRSTAKRSPGSSRSSPSRRP